jgi:hypothetical protein
MFNMNYYFEYNSLWCQYVSSPFLVPFKSRLFHSFGSSLAPLGRSGAKA